MAGIIPDRTIETIKERADILEVISRYVPMKKAGVNYVGLCPFHREKTPSFTVYRDKGFYKCFGCGKAGDVIGFLMDLEGMSFVEAVTDLAARYGIPVETESSGSAKKDKKFTRLLEINRDAQAFFYEQLKGDRGRRAVDYLKSRDIEGKTAALFSLGYAPGGWENLVEYFKKRGVDARLLIDAGLAIQGDRGPYDRFRDRIIFPIKNRRGETVGFGGRVIDTGEPKYMNSPETPVYHKGKILYGLDVTGSAIRREGQRRQRQGWAVIVEGYMDLIALYQGGVENVAATLGTALTSDHLGELKRYTKDVTLVFDADEAGARAAERTLPLFGEGSIYATVAVLPDGEDPDSLIRKGGRETFMKLVDEAPELFTFCLDRVFARHDIDTVRGQSAVLEEAVPIIAVKHQKHERDYYINRVADRLGVRPESVLTRLTQMRHARPGQQRQHEARSEADAEGKPDSLTPSRIERDIFKVAVNYPHLIDRAGLTHEHLELLETEAIKSVLFRLLDDEKTGNAINVSSLIPGDTPPEHTEILVNIAAIDREKNEIPDEETALSMLLGCVRTLDRQKKRRDIRRIDVQLKEETDEKRQQELLERKNKIIRQT
ncbi:MAG: DNA primase [Deltaproteobacteria bacterium]|nr:DNA primase [Candidatus Zymogenaceae bacterium]